MTEKDFIEKMMEILDLEDEPTLGDSLENFEDWDSLAMLSFMSIATKRIGHKISPEDVQNAKTLADLFDIITKG